MPRQHHSVFRGWLRQSPLFERQITGRRNLLTADQIRCLLRAGWYLERDGIWRDHLGGTYTEEQALAWLNSSTQS